MHPDVQTIINFHGIGTPERPCEAGEEPYWLSVKQFEDILKIIFRHRHTSNVGITFDDGNASDELWAKVGDGVKG